MGALLRSGLESMLPLQRSLDLDRRYDRVLLYDSMRDDHDRSAVENRNLKDMDYLSDYDKRDGTLSFRQRLEKRWLDRPSPRSLRSIRVPWP